MAYVVIQHRDPHRNSALSEIIAESTPMPVYEVKERIEVKPDCIYIISTNTDLKLVDRELHVVPRPEALHMPIDTFFIP